MKFNFNQLKSVYSEAIKSSDKSLAFDIGIGHGRFLFMMFLSIEDKDAKDNLFIYMRNSRVIQRLKTYGSHKKGDFIVYLNDEIQNKFINELQLKHGSNTPFDFERFLIELNGAIPLTIPIETKINALRQNRAVANDLQIVDEAEKNILIGTKHLSVGKPRDKTLRKLYLYTDNSPYEIDSLIKLLKSCNKTVAWTTEDKNYKAVELNNLINELKN